MNPLFWWILGAIVLLSVIGGILALISRRSLLRRTEEAFFREGCSPTRKIGDLWLDETNRRWTIARDCENLLLHRYDEVTGAELVQDGEKYVIRKGVIETYLGGVVLGTVIMGASHGDRPKEKAIQSMVINITLSDRGCPVETMVLCNSLTRLNSRAYQNLKRRATELLQAFEAMKVTEASSAASNTTEGNEKSKHVGPLRPVFALFAVLFDQGRTVCESSLLCSNYRLRKLSAYDCSSAKVATSHISSFRFTSPGSD